MRFCNDKKNTTSSHKLILINNINLIFILETSIELNDLNCGDI